jgi:hypothetical protein
MQEILDALIDSIITKKDSMPFLLRFFLKILYQECIANYLADYSEADILKLISEFLINRWIMPCCFMELAENGLCKDFHLEANCKDNLRFLGEVFCSLSLFRC